MASTTNLRLEFAIEGGGATGKKVHSYTYAKKGVTATDAKALGQAMIANTAMYPVTYTELLSAEFVEKTSTAISVA